MCSDKFLSFPTLLPYAYHVRMIENDGVSIWCCICDMEVAQGAVSKAIAGLVRHFHEVHKVTLKDTVTNDVKAYSGNSNSRGKERSF